mmetsp:Transcript_60421/g.134663  ORF Transcript_60421/g.134663 Transcript_60421/m.134663 type:complete len:221 (-) Transcript_60421:193-855(-)
MGGWRRCMPTAWPSCSGRTRRVSRAARSSSSSSTVATRRTRVGRCTRQGCRMWCAGRHECTTRLRGCWLRPSSARSPRAGVTPRRLSTRSPPSNSPPGPANSPTASPAQCPSSRYGIRYFRHGRKPTLALRPWRRGCRCFCVRPRQGTGRSRAADACWRAPRVRSRPLIGWGGWCGRKRGLPPAPPSLLLVQAFCLLSSRCSTRLVGLWYCDTVSSDRRS